MNPLKQYQRDKLPVDFYRRQNVCMVARQLIGKILVSYFDETITAGRIVETEAYNGVVDKASHAYNGRRTNRTAVMYEPGGLAYIYLCYGIHHLFNVVTGVAGVPHAVLIRAVEPLAGIDVMLQRAGRQKADYSLTSGPGNMSRALGIRTGQTGLSLAGNSLFIASDEMNISESQVVVTPRIGVSYAVEDALLPYRFLLKGNPYVSGKK